MNDVKDILRQDLDEINKMLAIIKQRIDEYKLDDAATLHYSKRKCGYQYYLRRDILFIYFFTETIRNRII